LFDGVGAQALEGRQVEEAVTSLFHTLLFHRTLGKFHYKQEGNYCVGTVGYQDVDCEFVDLTYVSLVKLTFTGFKSGLDSFELIHILLCGCEDLVLWVSCN